MHHPIQMKPADSENRNGECVEWVWEVVGVFLRIVLAERLNRLLVRIIQKCDRQAVFLVKIFSVAKFTVCLHPTKESSRYRERNRMEWRGVTTK